MRSACARTSFGATSLARLLAVLVLTAALAAQSNGVHPISGRRIAPVMGYQGAEWLERPERIEEEEPETALDVLKIKKGDAVADIGAGSGYMTVRLARRVGSTGMVFANDLQPEMIQILKDRIAKAKITNVVTVQGTVNDPKLADATVDLELLVDVYHEFREPQAMLRHLRTALKPNGRLALLEYRKEDPTIPIRPEHKMSVAEAKLEVEAEGFALSSVDESLPRQHILVFTVR
ncbi:MAG TPA: class I SAM-dependent methyltransferase [Vicinamibacterales bacterium]|nr:class I SAM-dependent methyltransferase [Vicinamibacterales bacterium]